MNKKMLSILLIAAMLFSMYGCQSSNIDAPTEPTEQESTAPTLDTQPSDPTQASDPTDATVPTETTESTDCTDPSESTENSLPTEATTATESPTTLPTVAPTEKPTEAPTTAPTQTPTAPAETVHVHSWVEATYQRPRYCTTCFKTQGSSLKRPQLRDFGGVTVRIAVPAPGDFSSSDKEWLYDEIERLFGCNISVTYLLPEYYYQKTNELLSSDNPPTIMKIDGSIEDCVALGERGKFVDIMAPENLAKMPNFKSLFVDNKTNNQLLMLTGAEDGSHYILPTYDMQNIDNYWFYNEAAIQKAGVQWNGNPDGFLNVLRRLKTYYPNSYPLTGGRFHETLNYVISSFGANSTYAAYDWEKKDWFFGATSDASYEMLRMYQAAYKEGLMNPAMLTQGSAGMINDITSQKSFICHTSLQWVNFLSEGVNYGDFTCGHILPTPAPVGTNGMNYQISDFSNTCGTVISAKDPKAAECAMAILDWLYDTSEEGGAWMNTVGTDFMLQTGENGLLNWIDTIEYTHTGTVNQKEYVEGMYSMFQEPLDVRVHPDSPYYNSCDEAAMAHQIGKQLDYFRAAPPLPQMDANLADLYSAAQADINQMRVNFITQNWDRAKFDVWAKDFNNTYKSVIDYLNLYF